MIPIKRRKHLTQFRLDIETEADLIKISEVIGFDKSKLLRMLVNRAIKQLKKEASRVGGMENLEISVKEVL